MLRHVKNGYANSLPRLKTWKFNICYPAKNLVCLGWILFGRPFDRDWLTMQPLFCYIFKRSSACIWLLPLTALCSLSPPWKRAKCSPRQEPPLQVCIFTAQTPPPPPPRKILATRLLVHTKMFLMSWKISWIIFNVICSQIKSTGAEIVHC